MDKISRCHDRELERIATVINDAARVYRGVIPTDCWHEPYMPRAQLQADIHAGIEFWGYEVADQLVGVMGIQRVRDVDLIRHAYVINGQQRAGVGTALIRYLLAFSSRQMWVGTWAAAHWAIRFYQRHGFALADASDTQQLLRTYWKIPATQASASVVLGKSAET